MIKSALLSLLLLLKLEYQIMKGVIIMAKVVLDWKAPSEKEMKVFVSSLGDDKKKEFAKACVEKKDGKIKIKRADAKKWLTENFDGTDEIEWKGRPAKREKRMSAAEEIASWLDL